MEGEPEPAGGAGREGAKLGAWAQLSGPGDRPPTGDRSRPPSALGCRSDPGIQDADGASPRMGRRPQLLTVKVRGDLSAGDQRRSGPNGSGIGVGRGDGGGDGEPGATREIGAQPNVLYLDL